MTPGARLKAVYEIIERAEQSKKPLDHICAVYFKSYRYIGSKDRAFIGDACFAIYRNFRKLDFWAAQAKLPNRLRGMVLAAAHFVLGWQKADFDKIGSGKYDFEKLSDAEARFIRDLGKDMTLPKMPDAVKFECPDWAFQKLQHIENPEKFFAAMNMEAPMDLRVNALKSTREEALRDIRLAGVEAEPTPFSPLGIRIAARLALGKLDVLQDGRAEVQDEGSQMIAEICEVKPGMRILDLCAGAGGKALALAAAMENKGRITLMDVHDKRLQNAAKRLARAGVSNHECKVLDKEGEKWLSRQIGAFDIVLVDAPCSGSGTWRRNPDAKFRYDEKSIAEFAALQSKILNDAAPLVKKGGKLVYATCSLFRDENEEQAESFLAAHSDYTLHKGDAVYLTPEGYLSLNSARHGTDGFFGAVFRRKIQS